MAGKNNFAAAVEQWNMALKLIGRQKQFWGDDLILLSYEKSFGPEGPAAFSALFDRLGLDPGLPPPVADFLGQATRKLAQAGPVAEEIRTHVEAKADHALYNSLLQHTL